MFSLRSRGKARKSLAGTAWPTSSPPPSAVAASEYLPGRRPRPLVPRPSPGLSRGPGPGEGDDRTGRSVAESQP